MDTDPSLGPLHPGMHDCLGEPSVFLTLGRSIEARLGEVQFSPHLGAPCNPFPTFHQSPEQVSGDSPGAPLLVIPTLLITALLIYPSPYAHGLTSQGTRTLPWTKPVTYSLSPHALELLPSVWPRKCIRARGVDVTLFTQTSPSGL